MKRIGMAYWTFTGLLAAFMTLASIPDLLSLPQAVTLFEHLGYPALSASLSRRRKTRGRGRDPRSGPCENQGVSLCRFSHRTHGCSVFTPECWGPCQSMVERIVGPRPADCSAPPCTQACSRRDRPARPASPRG